MNLSKRLVWSVYATILGTLAATVAAKAVSTVWELSTGDEPPEPNDPEVPLRRALTWAIASGIGVGVAQLMVNRFAAAGWAKVMGTPAPRFGKTTLTI
jgi:hypothetical protein